MPKFKVGDRVERIVGSLVPENMRCGVITRVVSTGGQDVAEYEVTLDNQMTVKFYETQLRPAPPAEDPTD